MLCLRSSMYCHRPFNAPRPFSSATDHASTRGPIFQHHVRAISTDRGESSSTRVHASNHRNFRGHLQEKGKKITADMRSEYGKKSEISFQNL
ncbi:hypothetical protein GOBAR_AA20922 [Gossypium barbadense]|uniref:Uncharacterized protein n=1 Tax=Gossypium barbadense TaxID=3634 RepID=A0A2P5X8U9_GOSBA|nr:hypothetical protein GOBAR_AA20922 [Gossypium barbadense]